MWAAFINSAPIIKSIINKIIFIILKNKKKNKNSLILNLSKISKQSYSITNSYDTPLNNKSSHLIESSASLLSQRRRGNLKNHQDIIYSSHQACVNSLTREPHDPHSLAHFYLHNNAWFFTN